MKRDAAWYLRRLRQMDAAEIAWRARSEVRDLGDILRAQSGWLPTTRGPLPRAAFRATEPATVDGEAKTRLLAQARDLLADRLSYFGQPPRHLGTPINWHQDWHSDIPASRKLSYFVDYRHLESTGDCKEVWEPNRHHQLVVLGRAFHATQDTTYADKIAELLTSWLDANPYGYGMNWRSPLEVAIRVINWVYAIDLIGGELPRPLSERVHTSAYLHCWDVVRKFSQGSSANNHLIGEAAGVFIAASYWFPQERAWIERAKTVLEQEIARQIYPSGCTREQALNYQFFVMQFFTYSGLIAERSGNAMSDAYWNALATMFEFVGALRGFEDQLPLFGDQDDGYVLDLGHHPHDVDAYLALYSGLRGEPVTGPAAWVLQPDSGFTPFAARPACRLDGKQSAHHDDCGYTLLHSEIETTSGAKSVLVLFDSGELGYGALAAHGHADALQFCLSIAGEPVFVDPGTYDYFTYPQWRNHFRSTAAHNTLRLGGVDQSQMSGPFMWRTRAEARTVAHEFDPSGGGSVCGEITHYPALEQNLRTLRRTLQLAPRNATERPLLAIDDEVAVDTDTEVERFFHIHPSVTVVQQDDNRFELQCKNVTLLLEFLQTSRCEIDKGVLGAFSKAYHCKEQGVCIVASDRVSGGQAVTLQTRMVVRGPGTNRNVQGDAEKDEENNEAKKKRTVS